MKLEGKPCLDHAADHRGLAWHLEAPYGLTRKRVRKQGQFLPFHLAPTATVAVRMPNQIDRAFAHGFPVKYLHSILHYVDFNERARGN